MKNKINNDVHQAVAALRNGDLVAFPTETVYGLGADARNPDAIRKVFAAKGRPSDHPLIVHIGKKQQMRDWAINIPMAAWTLADHYWPGPLTIILQKNPNVSDLITGGQDSIALRIPNHPMALALLQELNSGLVGPSANLYGHVSPTTAEHVIADLESSVSMVLDGGACKVGIESTIVNMLGPIPVIMRQGAITAAELGVSLGCVVKLNSNQNETVRTAGTHESHYAPHTPVVLLEMEDLLQQAKLQRCSVISMKAKPSKLSDEIFWQTVSSDPRLYAQDLYANLRAHDQLHNDVILIEQIPNNLDWAAIADRLARASFKA